MSIMAIYCVTSLEENTFCKYNGIVFPITPPIYPIKQKFTGSVCYVVSTSSNYHKYNQNEGVFVLNYDSRSIFLQLVVSIIFV